MKRNHNKSPITRYCKLRLNATRRGIDFTLSKEKFYELIQKPCIYCGNELPTYGGGMDRVKSEAGYSDDNVVPSCARCNNIKNKMSIQELLTHIPKFLKGLRKLSNDV